MSYDNASLLRGSDFCGCTFFWFSRNLGQFGLAPAQGTLDLLDLLLDTCFGSLLDRPRIHAIDLEKRLERIAVHTVAVAADVVAMHQRHGYHQRHRMGIKYPRACSPPILSMGLVLAGLDSHELAQVAMPVEEEVCVHLSRHQHQLGLVCLRESAAFLLGGFDYGANQGSPYALGRFVLQVAHACSRHLLIGFLGPFRARVNLLMLCAVLCVGTDVYLVSDFH